MTDVRVARTRPWSHLAYQADGVRFRVLILLLLAEVMVLAVGQVPLSLSWGSFAYMDEGANLAVQSLLDRGLTPTVDFGYTYGLLPLLIGRLWFGMLGRTPAAYAGAMLVVDLLMAWGLARSIAAMKSGPAGIALVFIAMPWAALASYISLAHAVEAVLICHALAEHASGRKSRALALLTACLFVKPSMAYVYGLLITILIVREGWASGSRGFLRSFVPSAAIGLVLLLLCGSWFGARPLINSLFPVAGAANYKLMHYGFFHGVGRRFWLPHDVGPAHYLFTPAGHYLVGTAVLGAAGLLSIWRLRRQRSGTAPGNDEVIACCGLMHIAFLTTFYADFMSWTYYYYILIIGLAGLAARGGPTALLIFGIAAAALVGDKYQISWVKQHWKADRPVADMAGLWTSEAECQSWRKIRDTIENRRTSLLSIQGEGLTTLVPGLEPAETVFLSPGIPLRADLQRKLDQVASAEVVLVKSFGPHTPFLDMWPVFIDALDGCELIDNNPNLLIFRRFRPPKSAAEADRQTRIE